MAGELSHIDFWDVGQGDCTVLHLSTGELILIDTGPSSSPIIDWLAKKPKDIRAIVLTHNDADHAGAFCPLAGALGGRIKSVYFLDYPRDEPKFRDLFASVYALYKKQNVVLERAEAGKVVWASDDNLTQLKILHPNFVHQVLGQSSNALSALIVLVHEDRIVAVWPGDLKFAKIIETVGNISVDLLVGPHHGGVADSKSEIKAWKKAFVPKEAFISVGTLNRYEHPKAPYLKMLTRKGCVVGCSELTRKCDSTRTSLAIPVFDGAGMLGLPANPSGVPCRGTRRVRFSEGRLHESRFDRSHRREVEGLSGPLCIPYEAGR